MIREMRILKGYLNGSIVFLSMVVIVTGSLAEEESQPVPQSGKQKDPRVEFREIKQLQGPKAPGPAEIKEIRVIHRAPLTPHVGGVVEKKIIESPPSFPTPPGSVEVEEIQKIPSEKDSPRIIDIERIEHASEIPPKLGRVKINRGTPLSDEQLQELLEDFDAFDVELRRKAIQKLLLSAGYLTHSQKERASPQVLRLFEEKTDETTRQNAADTLGMLRYAASVPALIDALQSEYRWTVRRPSASALGLIADSSATHPLLEAATEDGEIQVRIAALRALGRLKNLSVVDPLLNELQITQEPRLQASIIGALGNIGDTRVAPYLERLLEESPDYGVKEAAARALRMLKER
jgi:hypothetical protein